MKLSICLACYKRPQRTLRMLDAIVNQDMNDWELYVIGDGCSDFQKIMDDGSIEKYSKIAKSKGNAFFYWNENVHMGGWGYAIRNKVIQMATGDYFIFLDNDDLIKPNHFSNYYAGIKDTYYDWVYFNTFIEPTKQIRDSIDIFGRIGFAELIVKTSFLKNMPPIEDRYGHDWKLIESMKRNGLSKKINSEPTYIIKGVGDFREDTID